MALEYQDYRHNDVAGEGADNDNNPLLDKSLYSPPEKPNAFNQADSNKVIDEVVADDIAGDARKVHNIVEPDKEKAFYGIDLPFLKLGVQDWSLKFGADVGVAKVGTSLGKQTGAEAGAGIPGLVWADGNAGVQVDGNGLHGRAGGQGDFLKEQSFGVGGGAAGGFDVGPRTGAFVDQNARALGFNQRLTTGADVSKDGLNAGNRVKAGFSDVVGVHNDFEMALGPDSGIKNRVGAYAGSAEVGFNGGVDSDGNRLIRPNVGIDGGAGPDKVRADAGLQIGPGADLSIGGGVDHVDLDEGTESGKEAVASIGMGGVGAKITDLSDGRKSDDRKIGFGDQYASPRETDPEVLEAYDAYDMVAAERAQRDRLNFLATEQHIKEAEARLENLQGQRERAESRQQASDELGKLQAERQPRDQKPLEPKADQVLDKHNPVEMVRREQQQQQQQRSEADCPNPIDFDPMQVKFNRGDTIFDIAKRELAERSKHTHEKVDKDAIFRECNRIMVNSGFPDAHLDGKTNITSANLPKAWNSLRAGQVLTIYSAKDIND